MLDLCPLLLRSTTCLLDLDCDYHHHLPLHPLDLLTREGRLNPFPHVNLLSTMYSRVATSTTKAVQKALLLRTTVATTAPQKRNTLLQLNLCRGFAVNFDRSKPHVNIGTIGHVRNKQS
jgi:hypothetical protein